ncbi:hypothetical protein CRYUN_Cryun02cG0102000 [Craigia yunnanensis]
MDADPDIRSYIDIAGHAFGPKGRVIASLFICLQLFFVATGFLILERDNLHKPSPDFTLKLGSMTLDGRFSFVILSGIAILPSMWLSDLSAVSYASAGGVLSSLVIVVLLTSFVICTITYMSMEVLGYLIYGQNVQSQVTLNLPTEKVSSNVAIYTVLAAPIAKYALTAMPIITTIESRLPANYRVTSMGILVDHTPDKR